MILFGTRLFGQVCNSEHGHVTAQFFHINFIPLIPLKSMLVVDEECFELPSMHWPAVAHGYSKPVLFIACLLVFGKAILWMAFDAHAYISNETVQLVCGVLIAISGILFVYGINRFYNSLFQGAHPFEEEIFGAHMAYEQGGEHND